MKLTLSRPQPRPHVAAIGILFVCALDLIPATPAVAQIPETFTNLQLLENDTSRRKIVGIMRDWAGSLGVRCSHCHVGPDNLVGMDFASDEKPTKRTARRMLEMARTLNRTQLADLPSAEGGKAQVVSCYTCHRGQPKPPRQIGIVLGEKARDDGVDAALAHFETLRTEFADQGVYDLRARSLDRLAQPLLARQRADDATKAVKAGLALAPGDPTLSMTLARIQAEAGQIESARTTLRTAMRAHPDHPFLPGALARIESMAKPDDP